MLARRGWGGGGSRALSALHYRLFPLGADGRLLVWFGALVILCGGEFFLAYVHMHLACALGSSNCISQAGVVMADQQQTLINAFTAPCEGGVSGHRMDHGLMVWVCNALGNCCTGPMLG
jgi:hypothetical protein